MWTKIFPWRRIKPFLCGTLAFIFFVTAHGWWELGQNWRAAAQSSPLKVAVALSLTGAGELYGEGSLKGIQLAVEEANAAGSNRQIEITVYDDESNVDRVKEVATQIVNSDAILTIGPATTPMALASGAIYGENNMANVGTIATADAVTKNPTTFRTIFSTSDGGVAMADYLYYVLGGRNAAVLIKDDGYGRPVAEGFRRRATQLNLQADYYLFSTPEQAQNYTKEVLADPDQPTIVLAMLVADAVPIVKTIRRQKPQLPIIGTNAIAGEFFADLFKEEPEEQETPGYFTNQLYAFTSVLFDSVNAEMLAFADRFRNRFNQDPSYLNVHGYEAAVLAIAAARNAAQTVPSSDLNQLRAEAIAYLRSRNSPQRPIRGVGGLWWFTPNRGRDQSLRFGRYQSGIFESAPLQLVPVPHPDPKEIESGEVFELANSQKYARLQRVVYTGVFLNEIPSIELSQSSFIADFYLWLRFAKDARSNSPNPTEIRFPQMAIDEVLEGNFNGDEPAEQGTLPDGTEYRLWQVQGTFRNDFNLRLFPFDRQTLALSFFHIRAPMEEIVYVLDKQATLINSENLFTEESNPEEPNRNEGAQSADNLSDNRFAALASPYAFRKLTQWEPLSVRSRRENLVTSSALGDPTRTGIGTQRELSGFLVTIELKRRVVSTLVKVLLPLALMTLIMYASLYFPADSINEKVAVAITAALSGAVMLDSINNQLGGIGYTMAVEYAFYVFFGLSLLCMIGVLIDNRLRSMNEEKTANEVSFWTHIIFLGTVAGTVMSALVLYWQQ